MKLEDFSLPELYGLFLRFCQATEVINLRKTCKHLYAKIPALWEISDLTLQLDQSLQTLYSNYRFLSRLTIMHHSVQKLRVNARLLQLNDLTFIKLSQLDTLELDSGLKQMRQIFINHSPKLTTLNIPQKFTHLEMIYLTNLDLSEFTIHPTWTKLQVIGLISIYKLVRLAIPKECTYINYINISKSGIREIYLYPILKQSIIIQAGEVIHPIILYTFEKNIDHIQATSMINIHTIKE